MACIAKIHIKMHGHICCSPKSRRYQLIGGCENKDRTNGGVGWAGVGGTKEGGVTNNSKNINNSEWMLRTKVGAKPGYSSETGCRVILCDTLIH